MLTVIDEYTRECLAIVANRKMQFTGVMETPAKLFVTKGTPVRVGSDNGPESSAKAVREWLRGLGVETLFIEPGSPRRTATARASAADFATSS